MKYVYRISFLALLTLIFTALTLAQEEEVPLRCDRDELVTTQAELQALLDTFEADLETDAQTALGQLFEVGEQYQTLAFECGYIPDDIGERFIGTDVDTILTALESVNGDPLQGQLLYNNEAPAADGEPLGCAGCHNNAEIAPATEGTWTRWDEFRRDAPELDEPTFAHYITESIVLPWDYLVSGYDAVMPNNYGDRLSYQDLADIIAYLNSQDQFLD
jgi:mono/diheme cytochrome c family protein